MSTRKGVEWTGNRLRDLIGKQAQVVVGRVARYSSNREAQVDMVGVVQTAIAYGDGSGVIHFVGGCTTRWTPDDTVTILTLVEGRWEA